MATDEQNNSVTPQVSLEGLTLHVASIERALEFYMKIPGAKIDWHRPGAFALLSIGKGRLSFLQEGPTHLEFDTSNTDLLYQQFKAAGLPVEEAPSQKAWGEYDFTIHDPDGNCLEFNSPRHQYFGPRDQADSHPG